MKRCASLAILADYIGDAAAGRLAACFGGTMVKIPKRRAGVTWTRLAAAIGAEAAATLVETHAGEALYIARNADDEKRVRHAEVLARLRAGESPTAIARSYSWTAVYSERWVRRIRANHTASEQMTLFRAESLPAEK